MISATRTVNMKAAAVDGPAMKRVEDLRYTGHKVTARIVAHINGGKKLDAVHSASATSTTANTTRAFMRAPGPKGSGFLASSGAATTRVSSVLVFFPTAFAVPAIGSVRRRYGVTAKGFAT